MARAVERAIGAARRVAVMTSGGLDSSGLMVLATEWAQRTGGTVFAASIESEAPGDDRPHLRALESKLRCEVMRMEVEDAAPRVTSLLEGVDGAPFYCASTPAEVELMARARANGAECILTGVGGDELFDGDPRALASLARRGHVREALAMTRRLRGFPGPPPRSRIMRWVVRPLLAPFAPNWFRLRLARRRGLGAPPWAGPSLERMLGRRREARLLELERELEDGTALGDGVPPDLTRPEAVHHAWFRHQQEVASGIERRDPFLDRGLIAFTRTLPPDWLLFGGIRRGLFREAFRGSLPETLRLREDKAFCEPSIAKMIRAAGGLERFRPLSRETELAKLGIVAADRFAQAFDSFASSKIDEAPWRIWSFLATEAFLRRRVGRSW